MAAYQCFEYSQFFQQGSNIGCNELKASSAFNKLDVLMKVIELVKKNLVTVRELEHKRYQEMDSVL